MPNKVIAQNLYRTSVTSAPAIPATGDFQFDVAVAPAQKNGFLILGSENVATRQIFYFHDVIGNTIYVRGINRITAAAIAAPIGYSVKMNDVAELFNYYGDNISTLFYIEKMGGLSAKVWGGYLMYNNNQVVVADTTLTLTDGTTNYVKYDAPTNTISADTTASGNIKCEIVCSGGAITSILYRTSKESYLDFAISITGALPSQSGNSGKVLGSDGTNVSWVPKNDYALDTGAVNAYVATIPNFQLTTGAEVFVKIVNANTGTSTINVNGTGVKTIKKNVSANIVSGDILAGQLVSLIYDGTNFQLIGGITTSTAADLGVSVQASAYEAGIVAGDPVGLIQDALYKIIAENANSNTGATASLMFQSEKLNATTYVVCYSVGGTMYGVVCTVSGNTVTLGSAQTIGSAGTAIYGGMARIGTNKLAFVYMSSDAAFPSHPIYAAVGTVSGNTITMSGAVNVVSPSTGGTWTYYLVTVCRIRDDAFAFQAYDQSGGGAAYMCTVSGTTPSATTTLVGTSGSASLINLADNRIALWSSATANMYDINPASLVVTTTYTGTSPNVGCTIARVSDTAFVLGGNSSIADANIYLFEKPPSGTVLLRNSIGTLTATGHQLIPIYDGIHGVHTGGSIIVMDGKQVLWTIAGTTAMAGTMSFPVYMQGRIYYHSLTSLQSRIVSVARALYAGIATDAVGGFKSRFFLAAKSGVVFPYVYYLQADGTVNRTMYTTGATRIGKAVANGILLLE